MRVAGDQLDRGVWDDSRHSLCQRNVDIRLPNVAIGHGSFEPRFAVPAAGDGGRVARSGWDHVATDREDRRGGGTGSDMASADPFVGELRLNARWVLTPPSALPRMAQWREIPE